MESNLNVGSGLPRPKCGLKIQGAVTTPLLTILFLFCILIPVHAQTFESGPAQTMMIELFTSEGCSSCPPAEAWMNGLKTHPKLWKDFVPAAFHVTYWNYLGWQDKFAKPEFDNRQRAYVRAFNGTTLATPTVTVNAHRWSGWHSRKSIPKPVVENPGFLRVQSFPGNAYQVTFEPNGVKGNFEAHVALLGFQISTDVKGGENRGRILDHDFVALEYTKRPLVQEGNKLKASLTLAPPEKSVAKRLAVAVWVTNHNKIMPLQATGGYLEG